MAQGVVKSNKFFPVFVENKQEIIFKPLSKTKPWTTPYFAYSELIWSTIIKQYFDPNTPLYKLAICKNIEDDFENKYHHGTVVESIIKPSEKLINLYEFFRDNKDPLVNIDNYVNYCGRFYDYTNIFKSKFIKENNEIASMLAMQILISILRLDQNFHYENVLFKEKDAKITTVAPMLDHEFSSMFLYLDNLEENKKLFESGLWNLTALKESDTDIFAIFRYEAFAKLAQNLDVIVSDYPETTIEFLKKLKKFIFDLKQEPIILEDYGYLTPFNSDNYQIGEALFKENNMAKAKRLEQKLIQYDPDIKDVGRIVYEEILTTSQTLEQEIIKRLKR